MRKVKVCSILIILALLSTSVIAQDYLVTAKGDTLKGKIKVFVNGFDKKVQVTQSDKKKLTFNILQLQSFVIEDELYKPVKFGETYLFMKVLKRGYLNLYAFQIDKQLVYDGRYLLKLDGKGIEVPNLAFKKNMAKFLSDCPRISSEIEEGKYGYRDLDKLVDEFNLCITDKVNVQPTKITKQGSDLDVDLQKWDALEIKIQESKLTEKKDALEIVKEIKNKLKNNEQIPNFLIEALKNSLKSDKTLYKSVDDL